MHNAGAVRQQTWSETQSQETQPLAQVVAALPAVGIRRLILIALQLATELDLAEQSGRSPRRIDLETVWLERIDTPFEQALLRRGHVEWREADTRGTLRQLGGLLLQLLAERPSYLESAARGTARLEFRRRADCNVVNALRRALRLIAQHCLGGDAAYYASTFDVVADLERLARIASTSVARRGAARPLVCTHTPYPRRMGWRMRPLPKVIVNVAPPPPGSRVELLWRKWLASLRPTPLPA